MESSASTERGNVDAGQALKQRRLNREKQAVIQRSLLEQDAKTRGGYLGASWKGIDRAAIAF